MQARDHGVRHALGGQCGGARVGGTPGAMLLAHASVLHARCSLTSKYSRKVQQLSTVGLLAQDLCVKYIVRASRHILCTPPVRLSSLFVRPFPLAT